MMDMDDYDCPCLPGRIEFYKAIHDPKYKKAVALRVKEAIKDVKVIT